MNDRRRLARVAAVMALATSLTLTGPGIAFAEPNQPSFPGGGSVSDGDDGTDYQDDSSDHISPDEQRKAIESYQNAKSKIEQAKAKQRLKDMGIDPDKLGQQNAAAETTAPSESGDPSAAPTSTTTASTAGSVNDPVKGAGQTVKAGTGGPGPVGSINKVPADAGVGAPNKVAWKAVQKGVDILVSGKSMEYNGTRPAVDVSSNPGAGIDCSGLILLVYGASGIVTPGIAGSQKYGVSNPKGPGGGGPFAAGNPDTSKPLLKIKSPAEALPGDIFIWGSDGAAGAGSHVAMVLTKGATVTQDYGGGEIMQKPLNGPSSGRPLAGIFRPSVYADGKPVIPDAAN